VLVVPNAIVTRGDFDVSGTPTWPGAPDVGVSRVALVPRTAVRGIGAESPVRTASITVARNATAAATASTARSTDRKRAP